MICGEFAEIAGDYTRGQWLTDREREAVRRHLADCPVCRARLEEERALSGGLRALAGPFQAVRPEPDAEARALAAFRSRGGSRHWARWAALGMAAAAALLLLVPVEAPPPALPPAAAGEFVPLRAAPVLEAEEAAHLVRLAVPRAQLVRFGMPPNPDGATGAVEVEVLLGEDGVARAIRFVD